MALGGLRVPVPAGYPCWPKVKDWDEAWWAEWLLGKGWDEPAVADYLTKRRGLSLIVEKGTGKAKERHVLYSPTPKGVEFHLHPAPSLLFGGAAGGAKSYTARHDAYLRLFAVPGTQMLMLRRKFTELVDNHISDTIREVAVMAGLGLPIRYLKDERRVVVDHPGGAFSWLRYGHCENEGDELNYLSSPYDAVYVDEAATFTKKQVMEINGRLRSATGLLPKLRCTSNPGGSHTLWLKQWFIDRAVGPDEDPRYDPADWAFIPSKLYDNPYYMDPDGTWGTYEKRLTPLGPDRARQMLDGDWSVIAGQFFAEWRRERHTRRVDVGAGIQWFRALDWGYNNPGVCLWFACLPDGHLHIAREYVFRQTIAAEVAAEIQRQTHDMTRTDPKGLDRPISVRYTVADPSMWNHSGQVGESIAETFARHGVPLIRGSNEREIGWQRMRHWLRDAPDGVPWLTLDPDACPYLCRTLPALISDEVRAEDVDTAGDDHGADAARYGLMSRPMPTRVLAEDITPPPGSVGAMVRESWWASRARRVLGASQARRAS